MGSIRWKRQAGGGVYIDHERRLEGLSLDKPEVESIRHGNGSQATVGGGISGLG